MNLHIRDRRKYRTLRAWLSTHRTGQFASLTISVLVIGSLGIHLLPIGHAATYATSAEAESGSLSGNASTISDATASGGSAVTFGQASTAGAYTVVGNKIENSQGQQVIIHGVDRPSLEWSCNGASVTNGSGPIPASDFTTMHDKWNANAVRISVSQDRWLTGAADYCSSYRNNVETAISEARATGMIVIIDLHWSDQGNLATTSGQQCMPDQNSVTFWQQVAAIYKNDPKVWFELYNEPYPPGSTQSAQWNTWQNGGTVTCSALVGGGQATWNAPGMQTLVNTVRATGANNIVLTGGLAFSSVLASAPSLTGGNVAYAVHIYRQSSTWSTSSWDYQFGNLSATAPIIATEFGDQVCDGQGFDQALLDYFRSHHVGYTGWAWFVQSCAWPSLITDPAGDCNTATAGCVIQQDMESYGASPN